MLQSIPTVLSVSEFDAVRKAYLDLETYEISGLDLTFIAINLPNGSVFAKIKFSREVEEWELSKTK
jgi:hypothetical protein